MKKSDVFNIVKISLMTVVIILCGWITVPAPIPFTMQTFGIYTAVMLIGSKNALISLLLYILSGLAGLPVFSGFSSGIGHLLSPTGGYIFGFLMCPVLCLLGEKLNLGRNRNILLLSAGTLLCYITGTIWFLIYSNQSGSPTGLWSAVVLCILPYIIPDALKLSAAYFLSKKLKPILPKLSKE